MPAPPPILVWFRQDLRLADHPALRWAVDQKRPVVPVYLHTPEEEGDWPPGGAAQWWIHHALTDLANQLDHKGSSLVVRRGPALATLRALITETGADTVVWNRRYEPAIIERDRLIETALQEDGITPRSFNGALLFEPHEVETQQGKPYRARSISSSCSALRTLPRS